MIINQMLSHFVSQEKIDKAQKFIIKKTYEFPIAAVVATVALAILGFSALSSHSVVGVAIGLVQLLAASVVGYNIFINRINFYSLIKLAIAYHQAETSQEKGAIKIKSELIIEEIFISDVEAKKRDLAAKAIAKFWRASRNKKNKEQPKSPPNTASPSSTSRTSPISSPTHQSSPQPSPTHQMQQQPVNPYSQTPPPQLPY